MRLILLICFSLSFRMLFAFAEPMDSVGMKLIEGKLFVIHKVDKGENVATLSQRYNTSTASILSSNEISGSLLPGKLLRIPASHMKMSLSMMQYMAIEEMTETQWLNYSGQNTHPDKNATVMKKDEPQPVRVVTGKSGIHTVQKGETLYGISKAYGISVAELKSMNGLKDNNIHVGQQLKVPVRAESGQKPEVKEEPSPIEKKEVPEKTDENVVKADVEPAGKISAEPVEEADKKEEKPEFHVVETGETLYGIALRHGISVSDLKLWNKKADYVVHPGEKIMLKPEKEMHTADAGNHVKSDTEPIEEVVEKEEGEPKEEVPAIMTTPKYAKVWKEENPETKAPTTYVVEEIRAAPAGPEQTAQPGFFAWHPEIPMGTYVRVATGKGRFVVVKIAGNNTGDERKLMLSQKAWQYMMLDEGEVLVTLSYGVRDK